MMRTLARDITKYNQLEAGEDAQEETGWKLVSAGRVWVGVDGGHGVIAQPHVAQRSFHPPYQPWWLASRGVRTRAPGRAATIA